MQCDENCVVLVQKLPVYQSSLFPAAIPSNQEISSDNQSSSGLLVNHKLGLVATSAVLFAPQVDLLVKSTSQVGGHPGTIIPPNNFQKTIITVIFQNKSQSDIEDEYFSVPGKLLFLWRCEELHEIMSTSFSEREGWKFGEDESVDDLKEKSQKMVIEPMTLKSDVEVKENLIYWFALIKLEHSEKIKSGNQRLALYPSVNLRQGETLLACGTPFGALCPPVFMNSMSRGIVTNLAGKNNALIMTDARVMPGSEGAGLYVLPHGNFKQRKLVGMIVSPLCWKVNEWIGLTLAVSISTLLDSLQKLNFSQSHGSVQSSVLPSIVDNGYKDLLTSDVRKAINSVVYVQVGPIWGSGVIVDGVEGYVITCRHVVKNSKTRGVRIFIRYPRPMWIAADVVFSACNSSPIDLALLKLKHCPKSLQSVQPSNNITKGQKVIAVGHALFGFEIQKQPSVTSGIVSNTVKYKHQLVMVQLKNAEIVLAQGCFAPLPPPGSAPRSSLSPPPSPKPTDVVSHTFKISQSTCAVHSGASGGALLCAETGQLISIIASNSRDIDTNASFPHVNFSIPVTTFWHAIKSFIQTTDIRKLDILNNTDSSIKHLWQLDAPEINMNSKL